MNRVPAPRVRSATPGWNGLAQFKNAGNYVPLDRMAKQMRQQKQALFGGHCMINVDFRAIQITGQRVWNIRCVARFSRSNRRMGSYKRFHFNWLAQPWNRIREDIVVVE